MSRSTASKPRRISTAPGRSSVCTSSSVTAPSAERAGPHPGIGHLRQGQKVPDAGDRIAAREHAPAVGQRLEDLAKPLDRPVIRGFHDPVGARLEERPRVPAKAPRHRWPLDPKARRIAFEMALLHLAHRRVERVAERHDVPRAGQIPGLPPDHRARVAADGGGEVALLHPADEPSGLDDRGEGRRHRREADRPT